MGRGSGERMRTDADREWVDGSRKRRRKIRE